jgi:hypothetical protein
MRHHNCHHNFIVKTEMVEIQQEVYAAESGISEPDFDLRFILDVI